MASLIITHNKQQKPCSSFSRLKTLAAYIDDQEKCTARAAVGFENAPDRKAQIADMACACESLDRGGKLKLIEHWALSWRVDPGEEKPSHTEMFQAGKEALALLGYGECMAIMAIHEDKDHPHLHIVFPRINGGQDRIIKEPHGYGKAQKATAIIARGHGWKTAPRAQYEVKDGVLKRRFIPPRPKAEKADPARPSTLEKDLSNFYQANAGHFHGWKWGNLHRALAERGIQMDVKKGMGLVFSADGSAWESAAKICPAMTQTELTKALDGKPKYRKARPEIADILAQARATQTPKPTPQPTQNTKHKKQITTQLQNTTNKKQFTNSTPPDTPQKSKPAPTANSTTQKAPKKPSEPLLPPDKAKVLYRHHHAAAARIKRGCAPEEIAIHTALRIRACGHNVYEAMAIMADDPYMKTALPAAYTPAGRERLEKLMPLAASLRAQEKQALLPPGFTQRLEEEQKWRLNPNRSLKLNPD